MLTRGVNYDHDPARVKVEPMEGRSRVLLRSEAVRDEEGGYNADEVVFVLSRPVTAAEIEAGFDDWWAFGEANDTDRPKLTAEDRLAALEDAVAALIFGGCDDV